VLPGVVGLSLGGGVAGVLCVGAAEEASAILSGAGSGATGALHVRRRAIMLAFIIAW
jgi:hypothetical protein